ncbi:MAG TPA: DUF2911 domain-containing protein [Cyclobacteriaceae bacterium]|nr:DUF2911 domain-containing protein [Cyclobacteriaceae bacterium]
MKYSKLISLVLCMFTLLAVNESMAQEQKKRTSPPAKSEGMVGDVKVTIDYHSPAADGRKIMGDLVPYGKVWRTGANNATTVEFSKAIKVEGKELAAGKYEIFTIPGEKDWTVIFQKATGQWGSYTYKEENDVLRVSVKSEATKEFAESLKLGVDKDAMYIKWENTKVKLALKN